MKKIFSCEVHFFLSTHLNFIYDGFEKLRKRGIVNVTYKKVDDVGIKPVLKVVLNKKYTVIYDLLDGNNWIDGDDNTNLNYFRENIKADFYFKRSFSKEIIDYAPANCQVFPLGLNYPLHVEARYKALKNQIISTSIFKKLKPNYDRGFASEDFEMEPKINHPSRIVFFAKLWDPDKVANIDLKKERESINSKRIRVIKTCREVYGNLFSGGILKDDFTAKYCDKDLLASENITNRRNYLETVKKSNICISTTGLHKSIGWQMGEYVAASRCIVSMPLNYQLPGDFTEGDNYLVFKNENELVDKINLLLNNQTSQLEMMQKNFKYYKEFLRPDMLVLNTLQIISKNIPS